MERFFVLVLVGLTSVGVYVAGARGLRLTSGRIGKAVGKMLEGVGMMLVFFAVNLVLGMTIVLAARVLTQGFVSLYLANDVTLLGLSVVQGLTFQWWNEGSASWGQDVPGE